MIDFLVAAVAALLVLLGLAIIVGPDLPRLSRALLALVRHLRAQVDSGPGQSSPPEGRVRSVNATTQRALNAAERAAALLRRHDHPELGSRLHNAGGRLVGQEAAGLRAILTLWPRLERVRLEDEASQAALDRALRELHQAVMDRAEQLELLPFPG